MRTIADAKARGLTSMARKPPSPAALPETYFPVNDHERIEQFRRGTTFAAQKFVDDPEAGRREAAVAALRLVHQLTTDAHVIAPFKSLLEEHRPQRGKNPPAKWIPEARIAAATDGLMQIDDMTEALAADDVLKTVESTKFKLKLARADNVNPGTVKNLRTRYLNGVRNPDSGDAPDRAAIALFQHLRYKYSIIAKTPWLGNSIKFGILFDLRRQLIRLKADLPDGEGKLSGI
jgi:hypothetical protein